jgi:membrane protein DedA with SNARE-associated domain
MPFDLAGLLERGGYWILLIGTFLEGETVLVLAGIAAHEGLMSLPKVVAIAALGGFVGDQTFFLIGHLFGARLLDRFPKLKPGTERVRGLLHRFDALAIVSVRFLYGLRIVGPVAIGMSGIHWIRFLCFNLIGAILWASIIAYLGYSLGRTAGILLGRAGRLEQWALVVILAVGAGAWFVLRRRGAATSRQE